MSQNGDSKQPLYPETGQEELYEGTDAAEFDNAYNQNVPLGDGLTDEERARQEEEWKKELEKLEEEISTLRQVLNAKVKKSSELKQKLGKTALAEFKTDFKSSVKNITSSDTYRRTNEKLSELNEEITSSPAYQKTNAAVKAAGEKTATAFTSLGAFTSKKLTDARNSNVFKSFEEKMGGAYSTMKSKVTGSKSENNFEDALNSTTEEMPSPTDSTKTT